MRSKLLFVAFRLVVAALVFSLVAGACAPTVPPQITAETVFPDEGIIYAELRTYRDGQEVLRVAEFALETKERFAMHLFLNGFPHMVSAAAEWREEGDDHEIYVVFAIDTLVLLRGTVDPTQPIADQQIYEDAEMMKGQPEVLGFSAALEAVGIADADPNILMEIANSYNLLEPPLGDIINHLYHGTINDVPLLGLVGLATNATKEEELVKGLISAVISAAVGCWGFFPGLAVGVINVFVIVYGDTAVPPSPTPGSPIPDPHMAKELYDAGVGELLPNGSRDMGPYVVRPDGTVLMK
ncbi:MAG TPA: hypothetical protein VIH69_00965 [Dehalococcoidia bacterium]